MLVDILTLAILVVGLVGLIMPVFPGLVIMWLATLVYALLQGAAGRMTGWDWFLFALITILMLVGSVVDNLIIARKMRDHFIPWSSILFAFAASIVASIFFTPIIGLAAAPVGLIPGGNEKIEGSRRCNRIHKSLHGRLGLGFWRQGFNWSCNDRLLDVVGLGIR